MSEPSHSTEIIPTGFFPQQDNGTIRGSTEAAQDISYVNMVERQQALAKVLAANPDVETAYYWVGANPTVNSGRIMVDLKPFSQRKSAADVIAKLRKDALQVPGIAIIAVYIHSRDHHFVDFAIGGGRCAS